MREKKRERANQEIVENGIIEESEEVGGKRVDETSKSKRCRFHVAMAQSQFPVSLGILNFRMEIHLYLYLGY